jgi:hypothetical protein
VENVMSNPTPNPLDAITGSMRGPRGWQNWHAQRDGRPAHSALEYACYTDAALAGSIEHDLGPYRLLNTLATLANPQPARAQLALVLRVDLHLDETDEPELPPPMRVPDDISEAGDRRALDELFAGWTDTATYHGGQLDDELAALVSLALGFRLRSGGPIREFRPDNPDPRGRPIGFYHRPPYLPTPQDPRGLVLPDAAAGAELAEVVAPLIRYPDLSAGQAVALVRAARMYQEGLWIAEDDPRQAWLRFVSAIEVAASYWAVDRPPEEQLRTARPELAALLAAKGEDHLREVAALLTPILGATTKFIRFLVRFAPDPPPERPPEHQQVDWSSQARLRKHLGVIYDYRSKDLHAGTPMPQPMCDPPHQDEGLPPSEIPLGHWTSIGPEPAFWARKDTPMLLHVFAGMVRRALLAWWTMEGQEKDARGSSSS